MLDLLLAPDVLPFSAALLLMLAIGLIEAIGLGGSGVDLDIDVDSGPLDWLGVGQVPLLVLIVTFLAAFGGIGLAGQQVARDLTGDIVSAWFAVPAALIAALPLTAGLARILARIMPRDETTAFALDNLVGRHGTITLGRATTGSPARTRVVDPHGQAHHVLVEPADPSCIFEAGDTVLLVKRERDSFQAILHSAPRLTNWID